MRDSNTPSNGIGLIVSIIGALLLASVVFLVVNLVTNAGNKAANELTEFTNQLDTADILRFEGQTDVSGASVVSYLTDNKDEEICITVKTKLNFSGQNYNYTDNTRKDKLTADDNATLIAKAKSKTDQTYINPAATFTCSIVYDANKAIKQVIFEQN